MVLSARISPIGMKLGTTRRQYTRQVMRKFLRDTPKDRILYFCGQEIINIGKLCLLVCMSDYVLTPAQTALCNDLRPRDIPQERLNDRPNYCTG